MRILMGANSSVKVWLTGVWKSVIFSKTEVVGNDPLGKTSKCAMSLFPVKPAGGKTDHSGVIKDPISKITIVYHPFAKAPKDNALKASHEQARVMDGQKVGEILLFGGKNGQAFVKVKPKSSAYAADVVFGLRDWVDAGTAVIDSDECLKML